MVRLLSNKIYLNFFKFLSLNSFAKLSFYDVGKKRKDQKLNFMHGISAQRLVPLLCTIQGAHSSVKKPEMHVSKRNRHN